MKAMKVNDGIVFPGESLDEFVSRRFPYNKWCIEGRIEGYMSQEQKQQFQNELARRPEIKTVLEIGFNVGHSCEMFFDTVSPARFYSFDLNKHPYTKVGVEYFQTKYGDRFEFIAGDSNQTIPAFAKANPKVTCDLIYIDGGHSYSTLLNDITNCSLLAHAESVLWIDDTYVPDLKTAVWQCIEDGIIVGFDEMFTKDRSWVQAKYKKFGQRFD